MQKKSISAGKVAAGMAAYLMLGLLQMLIQLPLGPFAYVLYPALMALILPAPVLSYFHLADSSPWIGTWPNAGGIFVLLVGYTYLAYFAAKRVGGDAEK
ncbi:MAG: hypothetical protein JWP72_1387 [Massilia sp.]|jgi:hypothetical protein|nr:hypothetical protein [Massilia sp.]